MTTLILLPEALVVLAAAIALLAGTARGRRLDRVDAYLSPGVTVLLVVALWLELTQGAAVGTLFGGGFVQDRFALLAKAAVLVALSVVVAAADWEEEPSWLTLPMVLLAGFGCMVAASATSLLGLWAGFQLSMAAAAVAVSARHRELGLRLVLAAGLSGGLLALGFAFIYATAGVSTLSGIQHNLTAGSATIPLAIAVLLGLAGIAVGLLLAPFQYPAQEGYLGASPVGAATVGGVGVACAAVVAFKLGASLAGAWAAWAPALAVTAGAAMLFGALGALAARSPRSLVLWLGVSQVGWIAAGLAAHNRMGLGASAFLLAGFAIAAAAAPVLAGPAEAGFAGIRSLGDREPARAAGLALSLLSLAGVPPLAGFFGEFAVGVELASSRLGWLLAAGLLSGIVAVAACGRAILAMYLEPAAEERRRAGTRLDTVGEAVRFGGGLAAAVVVGAFGLLANPIHGLALQGASALGLR